MGEIMSMHMWNERRHEIREDTKNMVAQIAGRYKSAYSYCILQQLRSNMSEKHEQKMLLSSRKWQSYNRPLQSGSLYILGGSDHRKWRRRFCVLQPDYTLEVYDSEEDFHAANKPRFTRKHSSFKVEDNVDAYLSQTIKDYMRDFGYVTQNVSTILKKLGSPADANKRPTQHVLALSHPYRGTFFMAADTAVEKEKWLYSMQDAARHLSGIHCETEIERSAFEFAINKACDAEDHCGIKCVVSGTQEEIITDFITDYLASGCKTMLQTKVKGNMVKKYKMWDMISKHLAMLVESIVEVEYPPLRKKAEEEANQLRPKMMVSMPQITACYENISFEINAALEPSLKPELEKTIVSKLPDLVTSMADAMTSCLLQVRDVFVSLAESVQQQVKTTTPEFANNVDRFFLSNLDFAPRNPEIMQKTFETVQGTKSPLKPVTETFPKFQSLVHGNDLCVNLQKLLDSSIYTFETLCGEAVQKEGGQLKVTTVAKIHGRVLKKLGHDNMLVTKQYIQDVILAVTLRMMKYTIDTVAKEKIHELEDLIPHEYAEFMPVTNIFKDTVTNKLLEEIKPTLSVAFKRLTNDHFNMVRYHSCSTIDSHSSACSNTSDELSRPSKNDASSSQTDSSRSNSVKKVAQAPVAPVENPVIVHHGADEKLGPENQSSVNMENLTAGNVASNICLDENGEIGPMGDSEEAHGGSCMDGETGEVFQAKESETTEHDTESGENSGILDESGENPIKKQDEEKEEEIIQDTDAQDVPKIEDATEDAEKKDESSEDLNQPENPECQDESSQEMHQDENESKEGIVEKKDSSSEMQDVENEPQEITPADNEEPPLTQVDPQEAKVDEVDKKQSAIEGQHPNGKVEDMGDSKDKPPIPAPRKNRTPSHSPSASPQHGNCNNLNHNDIVSGIDPDLEKYSGVMEQIIHTGEEKLI